ncbi:MAG: heme oxygenase (biliverdin-producing) [Hydrogenophaga sp.]
MHDVSPHLLSARLRSGTRTLHAEAERTGVMRDLLRGRLGLPGYVALLQNLQALYAALEKALQSCESDAKVGPVCQPALFRQMAIERDLSAYGAPVTDPAVPLVPGMRAYVSRLETLGRGSSPRLVAHAYVRYLGDLHGGQVLARVVRDAFPWRSSAEAGGLDFYHFGSADVVAGHIGALRQALDALPLSPAETDAVIDEACWAFGQHVRVFEELARPADVSPLPHVP